MSLDISGSSLTPLAELISAADFPLFEFIPSVQTTGLFQTLHVARHSLIIVGDNLEIDCCLVFPGEISFGLPGGDSFAFVLGSAGPGWTAVRMELTVGPDFRLELKDLTCGLRFAPEVLRDPATGAGAILEFGGTLTIDVDGLRMSDFTGASLPKSAVAGTAVLVEASAVTLVLDGDDRPAFLAEQEDFRGVAFSSLAVTIPPDAFDLGPGQTLDLTIVDGAVGTTGFTGRCAFAMGAGQPVAGRFLGFEGALRAFELDVMENALVACGLVVDVKLAGLEENGRPKWVRLDAGFDQLGGFAASAAALQPPGTSTTPEALVTLDFVGAARFALTGLRVARDMQGPTPLWVICFSGKLKLQIPGATWPEIGFDELGIDSAGHLRLPEGGGITLEIPMVVDWYFARLMIPKFRFGRPEGSDSLLQIALAAEIDLVEGLPAGIGVEGLTITWDPNSGALPQVGFAGIAIDFSSPGVFSAGIEIAFTQQGGSVEFRGQGHLALGALDMSLQVGVIVGHDQPLDFSYLYLFADAELLPTGIPIGNSGLSIYGFQGLIAYNMALTLDTSLPEDERYYSLFVQPPIGITDIGKWGKHKGQNALGIGVVLGTADKGFAFNVKGLFAVAFPDLVLMLQAKANVLQIKPDLSTASEGTMDALMVFDSVQNTFTFDVVASWGIPGVVEVNGSARAFFDFDDPGAFYVRIGEDADSRRVSANVIRWGESWLYSAGFWFELNAQGVITGVLLEVGTRYESGGFWIEAVGRARGEMKLFWQPPQWEGSLALEGRIGAGYRGLSVGIALGGAATVRVAHPTAVHIHAEACFKALFWKVCKGHTFSWERNDPPILERPLRGVSATPRDWTLRVEAAPAPGGGGVAKADDGVTVLRQGTTSRRVQPHSVLSIDFAKPMIDETGRFNEAVKLPNGGFLTVGDTSGFAASYELTDVRLVRDPSGIAETVDLWGVWALETPNYNTTLRLLSSTRFGHDGSLTESFVEGVALDYCAPAEDRRVCLSLAGLTPGYGWIDGRYAYRWDTSKSKSPHAERRNDPFLELLPGDRFTVWLEGGEEDVRFIERKCPKRPQLDPGSPPPEDDADGAPTRDTRQGKLEPGKYGSVIIPVSDAPRCVADICFRAGHGAPEYAVGSRRGGSQTAKEEWTVPADAHLLNPGQVYELTITLKTRLRLPDGSVVEQSNAQVPWRTRFTVDRPPSIPAPSPPVSPRPIPGRRRVRSSPATTSRCVSSTAMSPTSMRRAAKPCRSACSTDRDVRWSTRTATPFWCPPSAPACPRNLCRRATGRSSTS